MGKSFPSAFVCVYTGNRGRTQESNVPRLAPNVDFRKRIGISSHFSLSLSSLQLL